jgi:DNA-binding response OmpR family regulator
MPTTIVLAIGLNEALLETQRDSLRRAGYIVTTAASIHDAIEEFREGDYDLVVMAQSMPAERRERLALTIRAMGSRVPMICLGESPRDFAAAVEGAKMGQAEVMREIGGLLVNWGKKPVARATVDSERQRRLAG